MSVNETVNQSQSAAAAGSGDSPEKLVADHVDRLWEHIAADGYDLLADVAVESLTRNGDVPPDAYLRSVKMSWCLHRAAVYYALQYSKERVSADFARGDAQFEHSLRAQAEREAEKLKADLAQSVLLVENLRLRIEEARAEGAEWCEEINKLRGSLGARREELTASFTANQELRQKLETAEAALLEQQQRNEELVTQTSQQFLKIAELQRQVEAVKTQELDGKKQELDGKTQELPAEYTPPEGWRVLAVGEPLQDGDMWVWPTADQLRQTVHVGAVVGANQRYIRPIESQPQPQPQPEPVQVREGWWRTRGGEVYEIQRMHESQSNLIAEGYAWKDTSNTHSWCNDGSLWNDGEQSNDDLVEYCGLIEPEPEPVQVQVQPQAQPAEYTPPQRWRVLQVGEVLQPGDVWVNHEGEPWPTKRVGEKVNDERYIRPIEPQVEALTMNGGDDSGGN